MRGENAQDFNTFLKSNIINDRAAPAGDQVLPVDISLHERSNFNLLVITDRAAPAADINDYRSAGHTR